MVRVDAWTIVGGVVATLVVSWIFDVEILFFMAIAVVGILALLFGAVLGGMLLAERFFLATATEKSGWRDVRASKAREPIAG